MKFKRVLAFVLIAAMLLMQNIVVIGADEANELVWNFDEMEGLLYIEGVGEMPDYTANSAPWSEYSSRIKKIIIGGDLTTVGRHAFKNCVNVSCVIIESERLETIRSSAFIGCSGITTLELPNSLKNVENGAFYNCRNLKEVIFNGTQEKWNEIGFGDNQYLLSANVTFMEMTDDFEKYYTDVEFEVITSYDYGEDFRFEAYGYDKDGNRCEIPNELCTVEGYDKYLTDVEQEVFIYYGEYSYVCFVYVHANETDEPVYSDVNFGYVKTEYEYGEEFYAEVYFFDENGEQIMIDDYVVDGYNCFKEGKQEVVISYNGASMTYIVTVYGDDGTNSGGSGSGGSNSGGSEIEDGVSWLVNGDGVLTVYGDGEILDYEDELPPWEGFNSNVTAIIITGNISAIGSSAFENFHEVEYVYIDSNVEIIRQGAFENCHGIQEIFLPSSIVAINDGAFRHCDNIRNIHYRGTEDEWMSVRCYDEYISNVPVEYECECTPELEDNSGIIVEDVWCDYYIGDEFHAEVYVYDSNNILTPIPLEECTIEGFDSSIPGEQEVTLSYGNHSFTYIVYVHGNEEKSEVRIICNQTEYMTGDKTFDVEVFEIDENGAQIPVFEDCYTVEGFDTSQEGEYDVTVTYNGYSETFRITVVKRDDLTWSFYEETGELVIDSEGPMSDYPDYDRPWEDYISQITSIKIGDKVTCIGERAFMFCEQLTSIEFGESLEIIGEAAFAHCVSLSKITIPDSVTLIDGNAFFNCYNLNEVTFGTGLLEIDECGSFSECKRLTQIVLPDSVERLGIAAFETCDSLEKIYIPVGITTIENRVFNNCEALTDVYYEGTQEQWEQMVINEYNDALDNANIHFNCTGITEPDEPEVPEEPDVPEEPTITVCFENVKTEYEYGEEFYVEVYEIVDDMMKQVCDYIIDGFDSFNPGWQMVTVRYGEYEQIYNVYVKEAVEVEPEVPVEPENAPTITVSTQRSCKGETVDVIVSLSNNTGFANLGLEIEYDKDVFTLVNVTGNASVGAIFTKAQSLEAYPYNFGWDSISNNTYNGEMAVLTFEVNENAIAGEYPISVDFYKGKNGDYIDGDAVNYDENEKALGLVYIDGAVTVYDYIPGDINDDGYVNNKDGTALLRYLANWTLVSINEDALDTDGDGMVTNKDGTALLRYLAGWDVELN